MNKLMVGTAQVECTPKMGVPFMGHLRQEYGAKGVHDPLQARAMVIADPQTNEKIALLTIDVCMITREQVRRLRSYVSSNCDIVSENILVAATHTHGSIATLSVYMMPQAANADIEHFIKSAGNAVIRANQELRPSVLEIGRAAEGRLSYNRRLKCRDGSTHMNWEELDPAFVTGTLGPIDPEMFVLCQRHNGERIAAMVNFPLHSAILDYENELFTADYICYLSQGLQDILGEKFISLFFNGCCGDINHINYADKDSPRRGYVMAQRVGYMLAACVAHSMRTVSPIAGQTLRISREMVQLERFKISDELYKKAKQFLDSDKQDEYAQSDGLDFKTAAPLWVQMYERQKTYDQVEVMAIRIGNVGIVGLPGEVFCEHGLEIKRQSPAKVTIVIELANDAAGYFPTDAAFDQGGYEVTPGATNYDRGSGERLVKSAIGQLNNLFKN